MCIRDRALTPTDPASAVDCYRQALAIPLDQRVSLGARINLAARLLELGQLDEALQLTQAATQAAPEVALGWANLGLMQRQKGNIGAALEAYSRAINLDPRNATCHQNHAVARLLGGDSEGARNSFRSAIQLFREQGRDREAQALRDKAQGLVKLDMEPII